LGFIFIISQEKYFFHIARGVLLPGAPDRAFLNKFKQREQIYHLLL